MRFYCSPYNDKGWQEYRKTNPFMPCCQFYKWVCTFGEQFSNCYHDVVCFYLLSHQFYHVVEGFRPHTSLYSCMKHANTAEGKAEIKKNI